METISITSDNIGYYTIESVVPDGYAVSAICAKDNYDTVVAGGSKGIFIKSGDMSRRGNTTVTAVVTFVKIS